MDIFVEALLSRFEKTVAGSRIAADSERVMRVARLAASAHGKLKQRRKYTGAPYIVHPIEVAVLVLEHGGSVEMVMGALMHDTLDDTDVAEAELVGVAGEEAVSYVREVTFKGQTGNRGARKAKARDALGVASAGAQTIKLGDIYSNVRTIVAHDRQFATIYVPEKVDDFRVMLDGAPSLRAQVRRLLVEASEALGIASEI